MKKALFTTFIFLFLVSVGLISKANAGWCYTSGSSVNNCYGTNTNNNYYGNTQYNYGYDSSSWYNYSNRYNNINPACLTGIWENGLPSQCYYNNNTNYYNQNTNNINPTCLTGIWENGLPSWCYYNNNNYYNQNNNYPIYSGNYDVSYIYQYYARTGRLPNGCVSGYNGGIYCSLTY